MPLAMPSSPPILSVSPEVSAGATRRAGRVLAAGGWRAAQGQDFPPHSHDVWEIVYYREGRIRCPIGDAVYTGRPGILLCTPPGTVHSEVALTAYANFWTLIEAPADTRWPFAVEDDGAGRIAQVCAALVREAQERQPDQAEMQSLLLRQLDLLIARASIRQSEPVSPAEAIVREAERILEETYPDARIEALARDVCVSPSTLRAAFQTSRGRSPRACLAAIRLRHALTLLRTSNLTLDSVAGRCGYASGAHLSRHVKAATGQTPGSVRRLEVADLEAPVHNVE